MPRDIVLNTAGIPRSAQARNRLTAPSRTIYFSFSAQSLRIRRDFVCCHGLQRPDQARVIEPAMAASDGRGEKLLRRRRVRQRNAQLLARLQRGGDARARLAVASAQPARLLAGAAVAAAAAVTA